MTNTSKEAERERDEYKRQWEYEQALRIETEDEFGALERSPTTKKVGRVLERKDAQLAAMRGFTEEVRMWAYDKDGPLYLKATKALASDAGEKLLARLKATEA